jgi:hypothetical protein
LELASQHLLSKGKFWGFEPPNSGLTLRLSRARNPQRSGG